MTNSLSRWVTASAVAGLLLGLAGCAAAGRPKASPGGVSLTVEGAGATVGGPAAASLDKFQGKLSAALRAKGLKPSVVAEGEPVPEGQPSVVVRVLELPRLGEGWREGRVVVSARCVASDRLVLEQTYEEEVFSSWSAQGGAPTGDQPQSRAMELVARAIAKDVAKVLRQG